MLVMNIQCNNCGNKEDCVYKNKTEELKQILEKDYSKNKHCNYNKNKYYNLGGYIKCAFYVSE